MKNMNSPQDPADNQRGSKNQRLNFPGDQLPYLEAYLASLIKDGGKVDEDDPLASHGYSMLAEIAREVLEGELQETTETPPYYARDALRLPSRPMHNGNGRYVSVEVTTGYASILEASRDDKYGGLVFRRVDVLTTASRTHVTYSESGASNGSYFDPGREWSRTTLYSSGKDASGIPTSTHYDALAGRALAQAIAAITLEPDPNSTSADQQQ